MVNYQPICSRVGQFFSPETNNRAAIINVDVNRACPAVIMPTEPSQQIIHARRLVTALTTRFPPRTRLPSLPRATISA